jgi:hypothetical protein
MELIRKAKEVGWKAKACLYGRSTRVRNDSFSSTFPVNATDDLLRHVLTCGGQRYDAAMMEYLSTLPHLPLLERAKYLPSVFPIASAELKPIRYPRQ